MSPSWRKRRQWTAQRSSPLRRPHRGSLLPPPSPPSPPAPPSGFGSIMSSPKIGRDNAKAPFSPFPWAARHLSPLRRPRRCLPRSLRSSFSSPTPPAPYPSRLDESIVVDRLIVMFICSTRPPARLPHWFRCSAALLAEVPTDSWPPPPRG